MTAAQIIDVWGVTGCMEVARFVALCALAVELPLMVSEYRAHRNAGGVR